jgi:hypothetical protein
MRKAIIIVAIGAAAMALIGGRAVRIGLPAVVSSEHRI